MNDYHIYWLYLKVENNRQQLIIRFKYAICSFTNHRIVLSQTEQFDVLDLYKTHTQDILPIILFWVN